MTGLSFTNTTATISLKEAKVKITMRIVFPLVLLLVLLMSCHDSVGPDMIAAPGFSHPSGQLDPETLITISSPEAGAHIRYTLDGSEPDDRSYLYLAPLRFGDLLPEYANSCLITAKAFKPGYHCSLSNQAVYSVDYEMTVDSCAISPEDATIPSGTSVTLSCATPGSIIRYTLNGSEPTVFSPLYSGQISIVQAGAVTLKARGFHVGWNPGPTAFACYQVTIPAQEMVLVNGGSFFNGVSNISLSSYYIDKYEVSQAAWQAVIGYIPQSLKQPKSDFPISYVSWFDAITYCNLRSLLEGLVPCYSYEDHGTNPYAWPSNWDNNASHHDRISCDWTAKGYRLPTEMEWMFAAKGGTLTHGYVYSGFGFVDNVAWYKGNSGYAVHSPGQKVPNELGIFDMSGNVREWCWDIYGAFSSDDLIDPHGASYGNKRCLRGGSWYSDSLSCEVSDRYSYSPGYDEAASFGFRCCRRAD